MRRLWVPVAVLLCAGVWSRAARADDTADAEALFDAGKALRDGGNIADACPKFEASLELSRTLGTLLSVADCREQTGKLGAALDDWTEAVRIATEKKDERLGFAEERRAALDKRAPRLVLAITQGAEPLEIVIGKREIPEARWGLPFPIDPGVVSVKVMRKEQLLETREVEAKEGETAKLAIDLAAIARAHPLPGPPEEPPNPAQRYAGITLMSVGLAGVAAFGILEGIALGQRSAANEPSGCVDKGDDVVVCSPRGFELAQRAGDLAEAGQWVGVGGLTVGAVGLTVFLTAPTTAAPMKEAPGAKGAALTIILPWFSPEGGGLFAGGKW